LPFCDSEKPPHALSSGGFSNRELSGLACRLLGAILAPILLPIILLLIGWSAVGTIRTRLRTWAWPKNDSFIKRRRQAAKGESP
jgi:hypothetical protein